MLVADRMIASVIMALSLYFMWHATVLPIGWNGNEGGPGGGAFPFWLSAIMFGVAGLILVRSFKRESIERSDGRPFFDREMIPAVAGVVLALVITVAMIPVIGAYLAIPFFLLWYLKLYAGHGWRVSSAITFCAPVFLFLFFEATLKILLPKGVTEPFFLPLYSYFF